MTYAGDWMLSLLLAVGVLMLIAAWEAVSTLVSVALWLW